MHENHCKGIGDYYGQAITVDEDQYVYTTGYLNSSADMDPEVGTSYMGSGIGVIFVSKLDLNGDDVWAITTPTLGFGYGADTSLCTAITITQTDEALEDAVIHLYPNPATETLNIQAQDLIESVTITNLLGAVVQFETMNHFSVAQLPQGIYLVRVQTASGTNNVRFMKL